MTSWRHTIHTGKHLPMCCLSLKRLVGSYIEKLFKGKCEARLIIGGSFGLQMPDGLFEDLLVPSVGLD